MIISKCRTLPWNQSARAVFRCRPILRFFALNMRRRISTLGCRASCLQGASCISHPRILVVLGFILVLSSVSAAQLQASSAILQSHARACCCRNFSRCVDDCFHHCRGRAFRLQVRGCDCRRICTRHGQGLSLDRHGMINLTYKILIRKNLKTRNRIITKIKKTQLQRPQMNGAQSPPISRQGRHRRPRRGGTRGAWRRACSIRRAAAVTVAHGHWHQCHGCLAHDRPMRKTPTMKRR